MPKKRADGRYEIKVRISREGEPRRYKAVYGSTLREAQAKARAMEAEVAALADATQNPSVKDVTETWLTMRARTLRPQSIRNYRTAARYVLDRIGEKPARAVTVDMARQTIANIEDEVSSYTAMRARKVISMAWKDAVIRSVVTSNPWDAVPIPQHKQAETRYLTEDELRLLDEADLVPADRALVSVLRYTGLRVGEATALQVKDIDLSGRTINVDKTNVDGVIFPPKTKSGVRKVPMPKVLTTILRIYMEMYIDEAPDAYLFSAAGRPWGRSAIRRHFIGIGEAAFGDDVPSGFTPHIFRHTYTHDLVANNIPPLTAQAILGHASYAITLSVYAHYGWKDVDMDSVANVFDGPKESAARSSK